MGALRSGKYAQGTSRLKRGNKFCCLGVVCDIFDKNGFDGKCKDDFVSELSYSISYPPKSVLEAIGITSQQANQLAHLNDKLQANFNVIADIIEQDRIESKAFI